MGTAGVYRPFVHSIGKREAEPAADACCFLPQCLQPHNLYLPWIHWIHRIQRIHWIHPLEYTVTSSTTSTTIIKQCNVNNCNNHAFKKNVMSSIEPINFTFQKLFSHY